MVESFNDRKYSEFIGEAYSQFRERLFNLVKRYVSLRQPAGSYVHISEDIVQDVFLKQLIGCTRRYVPRGKKLSCSSDSSVYNWLSALVINEAKNRLRKKELRKRTDKMENEMPDEDDENTLGDFLESESQNPENRADYSETESKILEELHIPERGNVELLQLTLSGLFPIHQNPHRDVYQNIALSLGILEGTVRSRTSEARKRLKGRLEELAILS